jgi:hypothetical protein
VLQCAKIVYDGYMIQQVVATYDSALTARVVRMTPLRYPDVADPSLDRPPHVRAGSSLAQVGDRLIVVQDDANFVALIDPQGHDVRAVPLPVGAGGLRQFDDVRGNKRFKLDLEACVVIPDRSGDILLAFGSGSSPLREQIAVIRGVGDMAPNVALVEAHELYAALRGAAGFAGSQMNIEGAVFVDDHIRLFGRGNGQTRDGLLPLDATCDLAWPALATYLEAPLMSPSPAPEGVTQYQLGSLGGVRLGFTNISLGRLAACDWASPMPPSPEAGYISRRLPRRHLTRRAMGQSRAPRLAYLIRRSTCAGASCAIGMARCSPVRSKGCCSIGQMPSAPISSWIATTLLNLLSSARSSCEGRGSFPVAAGCKLQATGFVASSAQRLQLQAWSITVKHNKTLS